MNTTPDFDEIGRTVPLESCSRLRALSALRLCFVTIAIYVCILQLLRMGFWSASVDKAIIIAGMWVGLGFYGESFELVWRKLGILGRFAAFAAMIIVGIGLVLTQGNLLWSVSEKVAPLLILCSMAFGLLHSLIEPLRALRYRQIKRYLRSVSSQKRRSMRQRLNLNFETLVAEGFD